MSMVQHHTSRVRAYVGIDNGISGAVALLAPGVERLWPLTVEDEGKDTLIDVSWLDKMLRDMGETYEMSVVVEKAQKFTLGRLALASTWASYAAVRAVLRLRDVPFTPVAPMQWQQEMLGRTRANPEDTKQASVRAAQALFPNVSLLRSERAKKPDHNMADALLMAEWARRHNL